MAFKNTRINPCAKETPRTIVVGDVHAHKNMLVELLCGSLGYDVNDRGRWTAPNDTHLVLDGDIINRGPDTPGMVALARQLQQQKIATIVRGNHEHEAVTMHACVHGKRDYPHWIPPQRKAVKQQYYNVFEKSYGSHRALLEEDIAWMERLPFSYETASLRVAHASFIPNNIQALQMAVHDPQNKTLPQDIEEAAYQTVMGRLFPLDDLKAIMPKVSERASEKATAAEKDLRIHVGSISFDKALVKSWKQPQAFYHNMADILLLPEHHPLTQWEIGTSAQQNFVQTHLVHNDPDPRPLLLGHYGLKGTPRIQHERAAVLDFKGYLTAYIHEADDPILRNERLVAIPL